MPREKELAYYPSLIRYLLNLVGATALAAGSFYYLSATSISSLSFANFFWVFPFVLFFVYTNRESRLHNKMLNVIILTLIFLLGVFILGNKAVGLVGLIFFGGGAMLVLWKILDKRPRLVLSSNGIGFEKGFLRQYTFFSLNKITGIKTEKVSAPYLFPFLTRIWNEEFLEVKLKSGQNPYVYISDLNKSSSEVKKEVAEFAKSHKISFKE